jgi:hypothetical protein
MGQKCSIGTYPEESQIVRCPVYGDGGCCSNYVYKFDTSGAKNHQGLIRVIGEGSSPEASKILDQKFNELEMKLEEFNVTSCNCVAIIILFIIPLVNLVMLCGLCYNSNKFNRIIQSHFEDWKQLGVQVEYCGSDDGREGSRARPPYILFILPYSKPQVPSLV